MDATTRRGSSRDEISPGASASAAVRRDRSRIDRHARPEALHDEGSSSVPEQAYKKVEARLDRKGIRYLFARRAPPREVHGHTAMMQKSERAVAFSNSPFCNAI